MTLAESIRRAYLVSTPLISVTTPDAASAISIVHSVVNKVQESNGRHGVSLQWDAVRGVTPVVVGAFKRGVDWRAGHEKAVDAINQISNGNPASLMNPEEMLDRMKDAPAGSVVFIHNAHLLLMRDGKPDLPTIQGVWNLRDIFKMDRRMLVLLSPGMSLPSELAHDVLTFEEALPDADQLLDVVKDVYAIGHKKHPTVSAGTALLAVDALAGLGHFTAEQATAMSLTTEGEADGEGIDLDGLWTHKKAMIDDTPGLTIWQPTTTLDDVVGYENAKVYLQSFLDMHDINLVVWIDEMEKQLHGAEGESNGIVMDQVNVLLQNMQQNKSHGMIYNGVPGTGKSLLSQSTGILTCQLDLGGMMNSLVGESQSRIREAMRIIHAVSRGKVLYIATCNSTASLTPALMRRFRSGKFFFDLPSNSELDLIWNHYLKVEGFGENWLSGARPNSNGWSPANVAECVEKARSMGYTLKESAKYIVPESRASAKVIEPLRREVEGVWISASYPGAYKVGRTLDDAGDFVDEEPNTTRNIIPLDTSAVDKLN